MKRTDILVRDDFLITWLILYGDLSLDEATYTIFPTIAIKYILATKRF